LAYHPDDGQWFTVGRILPGLARVNGDHKDAAGQGNAESQGDEGKGGERADGTGACGGELADGTGASSSGRADGTGASGSELTDGTDAVLVLRPVETLAPGLALLDAPDIDSVVDQNRALAAQLLAAADLWVFVTTAARYADAVPWGFLTEAAARDVVVAIVLDRVAPEIIEEVRADLVRLLAEHGLEDAPLFTVAHIQLAPGEQLPDQAIQPLRDWLHELATDAAKRSAVAKRTVTGAVLSIADTTDRAAATYAAELAIRDDLAARVDESFDAALDRIGGATKDGSLLRGEVLARWQEFVGAGDFFRNLEARVGWIRDRIGAAIFGRPQPTKPVEEAIHAGLVDLLVLQTDRAVDDARDAWASHPTGQNLVAGLETSPGLDDVADEHVQAWLSDLVDLIRTEGASRRATAKVLSYGVNAIGLALMITVFAATGGITGVEAGVAGGAVVVGQRVLEAVFGDEAVRRLTTRARANLLDRADEVLATQRIQFVERLESLGLDETLPAQLHADAALVRQRLEE